MTSCAAASTASEQPKSSTEKEPFSRPSRDAGNKEILTACKDGDPSVVISLLNEICRSADDVRSNPLLGKLLPMLDRNAVTRICRIAQSDPHLSRRFGKACFHGNANPANPEVQPSTSLQAWLLSCLRDNNSNLRNTCKVKQIELDVASIDLAGAHAIAHQLPQMRELRRQTLIDNGQEILVSANAGTGRTMLIFPGFSDIPMIDIAIIDAWLAQAGWSCVVIRDHSRQLHLSAIGSAGPTEHATRAHIEQILRNLNTKTLRVIGTSAGSFGAVRYGTSLGAGIINLFSPATTLCSDEISLLDDSRGQIVRTGVYRRIPHSTKYRMADELKASHWTGRLIASFGGENTLDKAHANKISQDPRVTLQEVRSCAAHNSLIPLITTRPVADALSLL